MAILGNDHDGWPRKIMAMQEDLVRRQQEENRRYQEQLQKAQSEYNYAQQSRVQDPRLAQLEHKVELLTIEVKEYAAMAQLAKAIMVAVGKDVGYLAVMCERCVKIEGAMYCERCPKIGMRETLSAIAEHTVRLLCPEDKQHVDDGLPI